MLPHHQRFPEKYRVYSKWYYKKFGKQRQLEKREAIKNSPSLLRKFREYNSKRGRKNKYSALVNFHDIPAKRRGKCPICLKTFNLVVDHCHKSNKFRGLICRRCNFGIGYLQDNPKNCQRAAKYLNS